MRMPAQVLTRKLGQQNLRARRSGAHQLAAVELHEMVAVVLVQGEPRAIGRDRFGEGAKGLHLFRDTLTAYRQRWECRVLKDICVSHECFWESLRRPDSPSPGLSTPCNLIFETELLHA